MSLVSFIRFIMSPIQLLKKTRYLTYLLARDFDRTIYLTPWNVVLLENCTSVLFQLDSVLELYFSSILVRQFVSLLYSMFFLIFGFFLLLLLLALL